MRNMFTELRIRCLMRMLLWYRIRLLNSVKSLRIRYHILSWKINSKALTYLIIMQGPLPAATETLTRVKPPLRLPGNLKNERFSHRVGLAAQASRACDCGSQKA